MREYNSIHNIVLTLKKTIELISKTWGGFEQPEDLRKIKGMEISIERDRHWFLDVKKSFLVGAGNAQEPIWLEEKDGVSS